MTKLIVYRINDDKTWRRVSDWSPRSNRFNDAAFLSPGRRKLRIRLRSDWAPSLDVDTFKGDEDLIGAFALERNTGHDTVVFASNYPY